MDMGLKGATLETLELAEYGDIAVEQRRYQLMDGAGTVADHGKCLVIWKRDGDDWKLHRDIWNTSTIPPDEVYLPIAGPRVLWSY